MTWQGRTLLGRVVGLHRGEGQVGSGYLHVDVRHFNGEPWPITPVYYAVDVLPVDYESSDD